jgi:hypothetical protein
VREALEEVARGRAGGAPPSLGDPKVGMEDDECSMLKRQLEPGCVLAAPDASGTARPAWTRAVAVARLPRPTAGTTSVGTAGTSPTAGTASGFMPGGGDANDSGECSTAPGPSRKSASAVGLLLLGLTAPLLGGDGLSVLVVVLFGGRRGNGREFRATEQHACYAQVSDRHER